MPAFRPFRTATLVLALAMLAACGVARAGTLTDFRFASAALGREQTARVYVPSGAAPPGGWPVLYLLHGLHGAPGDWDSLGGIAALLDDLVGARRIRPMVVAMPEGRNSWYVDSAMVGGPGDFATAILHDLPAALEAAMPVGRDKDHRAIGGISMGGYGALRLAFAAPDRYAAVAALSPALWQNIPLTARAAAAAPAYFQRLDPDTVTTGPDLPPPGGHFGTAFGTPFDPRRFNAANVFTLLEDAVEAHRKLPAIFLSVGDDDSHGLWRGSIAFFETMQANNLPLEFRVTDGDHTWAVWKAALPGLLLFVDAHLAGAAVR